jgi:hypothetical protein
MCNGLLLSGKHSMAPHRPPNVTTATGAWPKSIQRRTTQLAISVRPQLWPMQRTAGCELLQEIPGRLCRKHPAPEPRGTRRVHAAVGRVLHARRSAAGCHGLEPDMPCRDTRREKGRAESCGRVLPVDGDVRRNGRCDQELALALPKIESARRNGQLGGRPSKTHRDSQDRTHDVTEQETEQETHGEPVKNHPPTTNPQPPSSSLQPRESLTPVGKGNGKPKIPRGWYESDEGVMTVGESLGLPPKRGESARAYKARIESAVAGLGL